MRAKGRREFLAGVAGAGARADLLGGSAPSPRRAEGGQAAATSLPPRISCASTACSAGSCSSTRRRSEAGFGRCGGGRRGRRHRRRREHRAPVRRGVSREAGRGLRLPQAREGRQAPRPDPGAAHPARRRAQGDRRHPRGDEAEVAGAGAAPLADRQHSIVHPHVRAARRLGGHGALPYLPPALHRGRSSTVSATASKLRSTSCWAAVDSRARCKRWAISRRRWESTTSASSRPRSSALKSNLSADAAPTPRKLGRCCRRARLQTIAKSAATSDNEACTNGCRARVHCFTERSGALRGRSRAPPRPWRSRSRGSPRRLLRGQAAAPHCSNGGHDARLRAHRRSRLLRRLVRPDEQRARPGRLLHPSRQRAPPDDVDAHRKPRMGHRRVGH